MRGPAELATIEVNPEPMPAAPAANRELRFVGRGLERLSRLQTVRPTPKSTSTAMMIRTLESSAPERNQAPATMPAATVGKRRNRVAQSASRR